MARQFPRLVTKFLMAFDGWLVGGAADPKSAAPPRDFDVVIPWTSWAAAAQLVPRDAKPNSFGGWKFVDEGGALVDVWPDDVGRLMTCAMTAYLWHPRSGSRFVRCTNEPAPWVERYSDSGECPSSSPPPPPSGGIIYTSPYRYDDVVIAGVGGNFIPAAL